MTKFRFLAVAIVSLAASGWPAAADGIKWAVINNFGLFANAETQARFVTESADHLKCMQRTFSPGQCDNRRNTFGLTQQPYAVRFDTKTLQYDPELLHPRDGGAPDHVSIELDAPGAKERERCDWSIGARPAKNGPCQGFTASVKLGEDVDVKVAPRGGTADAAAKIHVRRLVIATFGDSFMSGEGNPHMRSRVDPVRGENWLESRCHRSLMTASAQAAVRLAEQRPHDYVAYYNFACSGATSETGVLGPYEGVMSSRLIDNMRGPDERATHFRGDKLPSQLDQAKRTLCARDNACVAPDVVFLSIGINTLKFSDTITELGMKSCDAKCLKQLDGRAEKGLQDLAGDDKGSLRRVYETLSRELKPKAAFAVEYPDATRNDKGAFCDANVLFPTLGKVGVGRIDAKENAWAHDKMLVPLNDAVAAAVKRVDGWQMITGTGEASRKHGFCADKTHFNSGQAAKGSSGTMHPNVVGHDVVAAMMLKAVQPLLDRK